MGKAIEKTYFDQEDYLEFAHQLTKETLLLEEFCKLGLLNENTQESGFELELWLLDQNFQPSYSNIEFINQINKKYLITEISQSSIEMNVPYDSLHEHSLSNHQKKLQNMMNDCYQQASKNLQHVISIGTLPGACSENYTKNTITSQQRYQAMDNYLNKLRNYQPRKIHLQGVESLDIAIDSTALVGAMSSFQMHFRVDFAKSARLYNASQALSSVLVAVSANSPFLFGKHIWDESRIIFYEQVLRTTTILDKLPRVSFGTGYIKNSLIDLFKENYTSYRPILPQIFQQKPEDFYHLRLHNGTIYRWNRPILGIDSNNKLHFRVEFRPLSAGPSLVDMIANAAFYYGITYFYTNRCNPIENELSFEKARFNFYTAAKNGLNTKIFWINNKKVSISWLIINVLLDQAKEGLMQLEIAAEDIDYYLSIIKERVLKKQTGSQWQKAFFKKNNFDFNTLIQAYLEQQYAGLPVHNWLTS